MTAAKIEVNYLPNTEWYQAHGDAIMQCILRAEEVLAKAVSYVDER